MSKIDTKNYNAEEIYTINDRIYHQGFEDTGTVIETGETTDKICKCTVEFDKTGCKSLIMGI